jgi:hypothetical protein
VDVAVNGPFRRHRKGLILHAAADEKLKNLGGDVSKVGFWMALRDRYLTPARVAAGPSCAEYDDEGRSMDFGESINFAANPDLD